ncbi:IclR family transcriptional regulator domain-containing protein [Streptomyces sp. 142MFCol3.1]|uniref:IclR family transcriptional regulator domain-containing protein n=1 Tax=Streptomyces sp. 142MFCol3.1 TaxID=1172179 RepID=UPI0004266909
MDQEWEEGPRSVAAPVRGRDGGVAAAVSIPVHAGRNSVEAVRRDLLPHPPATAAAIEADLRITDPARAASRGSATHR